MKKYRALDGFDLDRARVPSNPAWPLIQYQAQRCFGRLATIVWGELQNDDYLLDHYVERFNIEKDRAELRRALSQLRFPDEDLKFIEFAQSQKQYVTVNVLSSLGAFRIEKWLEAGVEATILLLGNRGNGKSTFIARLLRDLPGDSIVFSVNLALMTNQNQFEMEIYLSLLKQIDAKVTEIGSHNGLSAREIVDIRFKDDLNSIDGLIDDSDPTFIQIEKERRRSELLIEKNRLRSEPTRACLLYLKTGIDFLRGFSKRMCIVLDDVDRVSDLAIAERIKVEAHELSHTLNLPVVTTLREITARKIGDSFDSSKEYHIIPPSFQEVIAKRLKTFKLLIQRDYGQSTEYEFSAQDLIRYTETIIQSITSVKQNALMFHMLSNGNLELMFDYLKSLLASSHYTDEDIRMIIRGHKVQEHKILQTLLLYVYREYDRSNTFILNMYDPGEHEPVQTLNNLFRIRVLQVVREFGRMNGQNRKSIQYSELEDLLDKIGYRDVAETELKRLILLFEEFSIVETTAMGCDYKKATEIILSDAAFYYINHLIYTYRYLETVIPDTPVNYETRMGALQSDLKEIDLEIRRFVEYIRECEDEERLYLKDERVLSQLVHGESVSKRMLESFETARAKMMKPDTQNPS